MSLPEPRVSYDGLSAPGEPMVLSVIDPVTGRIWACTAQLDLGFQHSTEVYVTDDPSQSLHTHIVTPTTDCFITDIIYVASTAEVWIITSLAGGHHALIIYDASTETYVETVDTGARGTLNSRAAYNPVDEQVVIFSSGAIFYTVNPVTRVPGPNHFLTTSPVDAYTGRVLETPDYLIVFPFNGSYFMEVVSKADYTTPFAVIANPGDGSTATYDPVRNRIVLMSFTAVGSTRYFKVIELGTMTVTEHEFAVAPAPDPNYSVDFVGIVYCAYNNRYMFGCNSSPAGFSTTLHAVDPVSLTTLTTYTYEAYTGTRLMCQFLLTPVGNPNYLLSWDTTHVKRLYLGDPVPPPTPDPGPDPDFPPGHTPYPGRYAWASAAPTDGTTWLYDGSTGFWSMLKSAEISRHRVQFSFQCAGQTIGADYFNGKLYRITDTAYSDNGRAIEGEIIGETLALPDQAFLTVNKLRVSMEVGVGNTVAPGDNPQVALSVARDSAAKDFGPEMWKPLGKTGEVYQRLEWRRLGTTRYFTVRLRITDAVKRVITGASINASD